MSRKTARRENLVLSVIGIWALTILTLIAIGVGLHPKMLSVNRKEIAVG